MRHINGEPIGLSPKQLAAKMDVSLLTLYLWRRHGKGPPFYKIHQAVYYKPDDVDAWIEAQRR